MRLASFICLAFLCACNAHATEPQRDFSEGMLASIRAHVPNREMRISVDDPLAIEVAASGDFEEAVINLHRIYGFCEHAAAKDCEEIKSEFIDKIGLVPSRPTRSGLRLIVRDQQYIDYISARIPMGKRPIFKAIGQGLYSLLAFAGSDTIQLANADLLQEVGIDESDAWTLAWTQTKAILPEIPVVELKAGKPVAFQDYEFLASLLADTEQWTKIVREAPPDMFATVVADNFVFVAFMPSGPRLNDFAQTVRDDCLAQPRCISPYIYRFKNGRWEIAK